MSNVFFLIFIFIFYFFTLLYANKRGHIIYRSIRTVLLMVRVTARVGIAAANDFPQLNVCY